MMPLGRSKRKEDIVEVDLVAIFILRMYLTLTHRAALYHDDGIVAKRGLLLPTRKQTEMQWHWPVSRVVILIV